MRRYSEAVKADVRRRMSPPMRQSVAQISAELGIHVVTLYSWRKAWPLEGQVVPASQTGLIEVRQNSVPELVLHADNANAMRAATLESRLEELGVLATDVERQTLFRVVVPHGEIPTGLPKPSIH
jgi:transposase